MSQKELSIRKNFLDTYQCKPVPAWQLFFFQSAWRALGVLGVTYSSHIFSFPIANHNQG